MTIIIYHIVILVVLIMGAKTTLVRSSGDKAAKGTGSAGDMVPKGLKAIILKFVNIGTC